MSTIHDLTALKGYTEELIAVNTLIINRLASGDEYDLLWAERERLLLEISMINEPTNEMIMCELNAKYK